MNSSPEAEKQLFTESPVLKPTVFHLSQTDR